MAVPAVAAGWHTETGRRPANQDAVLAERLPDGRELIAVADGMGGHVAGEVASRLALETLHAAVASGSALGEAFVGANVAVRAAVHEHPEWVGMGTTLVALLRSGSHYEIANVGDSRAYRVTRQAVEQITTDHSFVAEAIAQGRMSVAEAQGSRWRNALTRAIGTDADIDVDLFGPYEAADPHAIVLCSDGFHGSVEQRALWACLAEDVEPEELATRLTAQAYSNGSSDNISVAIVRFGPGLAKEEVTVQREMPSARRPAHPRNAVAFPHALDTVSVPVGPPRRPLILMAPQRTKRGWALFSSAFRVDLLVVLALIAAAAVLLVRYT